MKRRKGPAKAADVEATVALFAALAHPLRLRMLLALSRRGELSVGEIQDHVEAEQTLVSHQLAALKKNRLVSAERDGRRMVYSLLDDHVAQIVEDALKHVSERD